MTGLPATSWPIREGGATGRIGYFGPTRRTALGAVKLHNGVDYEGPVGAPVYAAEDGVVTRAGFENPRNREQGYGLRLYLQGTALTLYAHLLCFSDLVHVGARIRAGQPVGNLGLSGNTMKPQGWPTPPHLHFGAKVGTKWVDPEIWLRQVASAQRA